MSYFIFAVADLMPFIMMYGFHRGVFAASPLHGVWLPLSYTLVMLALSFHVLARDPRPDGTSVRMASFGAMLAYAGLLSFELVLENRNWAVTIVALLFSILCFVIGGFAAWSVVERPTDYDVEEAE